MSAVTWPGFALAQVDWTLDRPAQVNASNLTPIREADTDPWFGKWSAKVTLATVESEAAFAPFRSFLLRLNGPANTFNLPAVVEPQNGNSGVTLSSSAAAGDNTISLSGVSTPLKDGQLVTVNGQLLQLTADQTGTSITFEPDLRAAASSGTAVETANPYATVSLSDQSISWAVSPPQRFDCDFAVEEAI